MEDLQASTGGFGKECFDFEGEGRMRDGIGSRSRENVKDVSSVLWKRRMGRKIGRMKNRGVLPIDLTLLGYRHYNYEINLIYILQFSLTVPPSIDIPTTITRIRKVMENQLLSAHSSFSSLSQ